MKFGRIVRGMIVGMAFAASLVLVGCAVEAGNADALEGDVGETAEAIGAECERASPTARFVGGFDYTSPQTYTTANCYKAVVLDVTNYKTGFTTPPCPIAELYTTVGWEDEVPTPKAGCDQMWVRADLFEIVQGVPVYKGYQETFGWMYGNACHAGLTIDPSMMEAGKSYRVAATARTDNTSAAPTRRLSVTSAWSWGSCIQ